MCKNSNLKKQQKKPGPPPLGIKWDAPYGVPKPLTVTDAYYHNYLLDIMQILLGYVLLVDQLALLVKIDISVLT